MSVNEKQVGDFLAALHGDGPYTIVGFFGERRKVAYCTDATHALRCVKELDRDGATGVFTMLNPLRDVYLNSQERNVVQPARTLPKNDDVSEIRWLLIDVDPMRATGTCSTNPQKAEAKSVAQEIRESLRASGFPEPLSADSGNGWAMYYRLSAGLGIDKVKQTVQALSAKHSNATVHVDTSVTSQKQLTRLCGTLNRKGDNTPERPHRLSRVSFPDGIEPSNVFDSLGRITADDIARVATVEIREPKKSSAALGTRELARIVSALSSIDVDNLEYQEWLNCLMALHSTGDARAKGLARDWCKQSPPKSEGGKYDGDEAFDRKWDSFVSSGITAGTLFRVAQNLGWQDLVVTNYETRESDKGKPVAVPLPMGDILDRVQSMGLDLFVCRESLYVKDGNTARSLNTEDELFAFLWEVCEVRWNSKGCVSKGEFLVSLMRRAKVVSSVEPGEHFPRLDDVCYLNPPPSGRDTSELNRLLDLMGLQGVERALFVAYLATCVWGGPSGQRPAWFFVSENPGAGKSQAAYMGGYLASLGAGGYYAIRERQDIDQLAKHLVGMSVLSLVRVLLLDNVKTQLRGADLESLVTMPTITGHGMYRGFMSTPNRYVVVATSTGVDVSKDMASRSVVINFDHVVYSPTYMEGLQSMDWSKVMEGIAAIFATPKVVTKRHTRWASWCADVLSRVSQRKDLGYDHSADELVDTILDRCDDLANGDETGDAVRERLVNLLSTSGHNPDTCHVHLKGSDVAAYMGGLDGQNRWTTNATSRLLKEVATNGQVSELSVCKDTALRGFVWQGVAARDTKLVKLREPEMFS